MNAEKDLFELQDKAYAEFESKIVPNINKEKFIGVKMPLIRDLAKKYYTDNNYASFLQELPHKYYEENLLHGALISEIKDYDLCIDELEKFLKYIDNWAVCDTIKPKSFKKNKEKLIIKIKEWIKSKHLYTSRFGIEMLMNNYLGDDYRKEYLELPLVKTDEYYLKMMIAWFYAEALIKRWDDAVKYIENNKLDVWTHNKTISKCSDSYRLTKDQKDYLKKLRREK